MDRVLRFLSPGSPDSMAPKTNKDRNKDNGIDLDHSSSPETTNVLIREDKNRNKDNDIDLAHSNSPEPTNSMMKVDKPNKKNTLKESTREDKQVRSNVATLQPYEYGKKQQYIPRTRTTNSYDRYINLSIDKDVDIFDAHREIIKCCGRKPKISIQNSNNLVIEAGSLEESTNLLALSTLGGAAVQSTPNDSLNCSKGIIYAPQLMKYPEDKLQKELKDQGVIKVERVHKKIEGALIAQPSLILTIDMPRLPEFIFAAWHRYKIKIYIPRPRRCFHCQKFGHTVTSCRSKNQGGSAVCINCGDEEHGRCNKESKCIHCGEGHPSSSIHCDIFKLEKEIQAIRVIEKITFKEAREKALSKMVRPGLSFASVVARYKSSRNSERRTESSKSNEQHGPNRESVKRTINEISDLTDERSVRSKFNDQVDNHTPNDLKQIEVSVETHSPPEVKLSEMLNPSNYTKNGSVGVSPGSVNGDSGSADADPLSSSAEAFAQTEQVSVDADPLASSSDGAFASPEAELAVASSTKLPMENPSSENTMAEDESSVEMVTANNLGQQTSEKNELTQMEAKKGFWKYENKNRKPPPDKIFQLQTSRKSGPKFSRGNLTKGSKWI